MSASDSTERYRSIVETAVDAIVTIDERGRIESVNPATETLFGYAAAEMLGRNVSMLMPEPHASAHDGYLRRYLAGGAPRIIGVGREVVARRKDGSTFPMHLAVGEMEVDGRRMFTGVIRDLSDRITAEEALRASEERYRAIIDTAVDGIIGISSDGTVVDFNRAAEGIFGYPAADVVGRNVRMLMPEPDHSAHDSYLQRYLAGGAPRIIGTGREVVGLRRDGTTFPMHLGVSEVRHGEERRFTGIVRDMTDLRAAEREAAAQRDYVAAVVESLQDGLVVRELDGTVAHVNARFCELTGYSSEELLGARPPLPYWPDDATDPLDAVAAAGGEADIVFRRRDGTRVIVIVAAAPVRDEWGTPLRYVETVKDVTARRLAEEQLAAERDHAAGILAALRDGLIVFSPGGVVLDVNDTFLELVGLERDQVIGIAGPPFPWRADIPAAHDVFSRAAASGGGDTELVFRRSTGEVFPVQLSTASRRDADGRFLGFVATCRDLRPMRAAQEDLRRSEAAQRESETLLAAERDAQRLKDEFLAMVSHELRTPLAAVVGYLELAIADVDDPDVRDLLAVAERNGRRLAALVRDILLVAQADAGRLSLDMRPVLLGDLVSQAVLAARPSAGARGVELRGEVSANPSMRADPDRLGQVLDNLISNAIKFSPSGGRVRVSLESGPSWARITVADEGPGIPPDEIARLFEPFYRARQASSDGVPGTGLGLAVVKAIAEAHGGSVAVDTELGRGSSFRADLPLEAEEARFAPLGARG